MPVFVFLPERFRSSPAPMNLRCFSVFAGMEKPPFRTAPVRYSAEGEACINVRRKLRYSPVASCDAMARLRLIRQHQAAGHIGGADGDAGDVAVLDLAR